MLDYKFVVEGSDSYTDGEHGSSGGSSTSYRDQTVVLLPADECEVSSFLLLPRSLRTWVAGMVGQGGVCLSTEQISCHNAANIERFEKAYLLVANVETEPTTTADAESGESSGKLSVHRLFSPPAIRFLADHPGWTVEGHGRHLAFYQSRKIIPAAGRRRFLDEALALRAALVESQDEVSVLTPIAETSSAPEAASDRMAGMIIGAFCGFVLGGILGVMLAVQTLSHFDERDSNIVFALVLGGVPLFGGALGGLIFGAIIGRWGLGRFITSIRRKRRERLLVENPGRWPGQPPESTATVEEDGDTLIVSLPPVSLMRPIGYLLFAFVVLLNVVLPALTMTFLPALFDADPIAVGLITAGWLVDVLLLTILFYHGRLRTRLSISSDRLTIERYTLFGMRRRELPAARITRFQAFLPPLVWGNAWLSIESTGQLWPLALFRNRHHAEVAWLSKLIKDQMTLPESKP